jgi:hypothetical protein
LALFTYLAAFLAALLASRLAFLSYFLATFLADLSAAFFFNASVLAAGLLTPFKEAFVLASFASLAACLLALATLRFD